MASVLDGVNRLTQLAGHNKLELLMFRLGANQRYGVNVFKVQEVIHCPRLSRFPEAHPCIKGIATIRGKTIPVIDLSYAIGLPEICTIDEVEHHFIVVTEYNLKVQGFLVSGVDRIINMNWDDIKPPPAGVGQDCYLTAVTRYEDDFIEIIDVEKVLSEISGTSMGLSQSSVESSSTVDVKDKIVLAVDDSSVARGQIKVPLDQIGIEYYMAKNGREALDLLLNWKENSPEKLEQLKLIISDVEMPEMDGYTLTTEIRNDSELKHLYIVLHTSLSGIFNNAMVEKVGANKFLPKYDPDVLCATILERVSGNIQDKDSMADGKNVSDGAAA